MGKDILQPAVCGIDDLPSEIRDKLISAPEHFCIDDDSILMMIDRNVYRLTNDSAGKMLANAIVQNKKVMLTKPKDENELYERILHDPDYIPDPEIVRAYKIKPSVSRCAAIFRSFSPNEYNLYTLLSSMAPLENGDIIIPDGFRTALFIKNPDGQTEEEINEFFAAVVGTMETEGIDDIRVGIGGTYSGFSGLRQSYLESVQALQLGRKYHRKDHIYAYSGQILERIVDSIPKEEKTKVLHDFFGDKTGNTLSDEMLETVRVFFRNDLNLTAASKQLFIHRNTLNYRLDKIKKDFGLDLRIFRDAVIFRVITEIANEKETQSDKD